MLCSMLHHALLGCLDSQVPLAAMPQFVHLGSHSALLSLVLSRNALLQVCAIDPKWLVELAPRFFRAADTQKLSRRKRAERLEPLYDRYNDPHAWRLSRRRA